MKLGKIDLEGNAGIRIIHLVLAFLMVVSAFAAVVPVSREAEGWTSVSPFGSSSHLGEYMSGYIRQYDASSPSSYYNYFSTTMYIGHISGYDDFRASIGFPLYGFDERTYVSSITLTIRVLNFYGSSYYLYVDILDENPLYPGYETGYQEINNGISLGSIYVTGSGYYSISFPSTQIIRIRNMISDGDDFVFMGLRYFEAGGYYGSNRYLRVSATSSYLRMDVDSSPPNTPSLDDLDEFTDGSSVSLDWNAVSDNPSGGSYGYVRYQAGVFDNSTSLEPLYTSPWLTGTAYTFNSLADGEKYFFRVRSKDGLGFESSWSLYRVTTMDSTPPTVPGLTAEPAYTEGTENTLLWIPSTDTASGVDYYMVLRSDNPDLADADGMGTPNNYYTWTGLAGEQNHYFAVAAVDELGHISQISPVVRSYQDTAPPSVPVMMSEPPFTKGDTNTFQWYPSMDAGIGVGNYSYEVATADDFNPASIVLHGNTNRTFFEAAGLVDGTRYWVRVKAADLFDHESDWSRSVWSIQDISGPGSLSLVPLDSYIPEGPVRLEWNAAEDTGAGTGWYRVLWSTDPSFSTGVHEMDHIVGHSYTISGLDSGVPWYFKVTSFDSLGNEGDSEMTGTTLDDSPPTVPLIDPLPEYAGGESIHLSWSESVDSLSGLDHYVVNVYTSEDRIGLAFTVHTTDTEFSVPGLSNGMTYYYEVVAVDRAGNRIVSALRHCIQDSEGPSIPVMMDLPFYSTSGLVPISWSPSVDDGAGDVEYQVQYASDPLFTVNAHETDWMADTAWTLQDISGMTRAGEAPLSDGTYYVHVRSRDGLGTMSPFGPLDKVVVDRTGPDRVNILDGGRYYGGTTARIVWEESSDNIGGEILYQVTAHEEEDGPAVVSSPWIGETEYTLGDLSGGKDYYIYVTAKDEAGLPSEPSIPQMITMDNTPPRLTLDGDGLFGGSDQYISGEAEDSQCGLEVVQISFDDGLTWNDCEVNSGKWSFQIVNVPEGTTSFMVRAIDNGGNIGDSSHGSIDLSPPEISFTHPQADSVVSGPVQIMGTINDQNLESYSVEYKPAGGEWEEVLPEQTTSGFSGVLATWLTSGLPGGDYKLKVTATDRLGQVSSGELSLKLAGASILLDPSMVSFSNTHPASGDKVTVFLTLTNLGDSPAEGLTVVLYDGGKEITTKTGVTVPARGTTVVTGEFTAGSRNEITAKVSSDVMGEVSMDDPAVLESVEDEMIMENLGGIIGMIALVLALIAIVLVFVMGRGRKEKKEKVEPKEAEIREKGEKTEAPKAQSLSPGTPSASKPQLPTASPPAAAPKKPALPSPTVAPQSMPKSEPPQQQPSLQAAPAPKADSITYMAPNKQEHQVGLNK